MYRRKFKTRLLASAAVFAALTMAGCSTMNTAGTTGSVASGAVPKSESDWRRETEIRGERYRQNQKDADAAVGYAQALRVTGQRTQAVAVLEQASIYNPRNTTVLGAYGRALAETGSLSQALDVLGRAHTPDQPDWRILSAQGTVLDQMGRHDDARRHYTSALKIVPDEPSVTSNLGLSYALSKDLRKAEETLRRASAQSGAEPRVRQNLALVVGLQGRFEEAETIARGDLAPDQAAANLDFLRHMLAEEKSGKKGRGRALKQAARSEPDA